MENYNELPMGFSMALMKNEAAMKYFQSLDESQKQQIIANTHNINSKKEMQSYMNSLSSGNENNYNNFTN